MVFRNNKRRCSALEQKYDTLTVEKVQLKFCKILVGAQKLASSNAVRVEIGIFPLVIFCLKSCVIFWLCIINMNNSKLVYNAYKGVICSETGFTHHIKLFRFFTCMGKSRYIFESKITKCNYKEIKRFLYSTFRKTNVYLMTIQI